MAGVRCSAENPTARVTRNARARMALIVVRAHDAMGYTVVLTIVVITNIMSGNAGQSEARNQGGGRHTGRGVVDRAGAQPAHAGAVRRLRGLGQGDERNGARLCRAAEAVRLVDD